MTQDPRAAGPAGRRRGAVMMTTVVLKRYRRASTLHLYDPGSFGDARAEVRFVNGTSHVDEKRSWFTLNGRHVSLADFLRRTGLTQAEL